jgi:hypothetical protein
MGLLPYVEGYRAGYKAASAADGPGGKGYNAAVRSLSLFVPARTCTNAINRHLLVPLFLCRTHNKQFAVYVRLKVFLYYLAISWYRFWGTQLTMNAHKLNLDTFFVWQYRTGMQAGMLAVQNKLSFLDSVRPCPLVLCMVRNQ